MAAERPQALGSQHLDALDRRQRNGVQVVPGRRVGTPVHHNEQVAPAGEEVADDSRVEQLAERLGAVALDEAAVVLGNDLRGRRQRAAMDRMQITRPEHDGRSEGRQSFTHSGVLHWCLPTYFKKRFPRIVLHAG